MHESPAALWLIGSASLLEATIIPIPLELLLIPLLFWRRHQIWIICFIATGACLIGASIFYGVGHFFFDLWGEQVIGWSGGDSGSEEVFREMVKDHGFWAVLFIALTPIPFQIGMLMAGAASYSFPLFLLASAIGRGIRYFGLGWLVQHYGENAAAAWKKHRLRTALIAGGIVIFLWLLSTVFFSG